MSSAEITYTPENRPQPPPPPSPLRSAALLVALMLLLALLGPGACKALGLAPAGPAAPAPSASGSAASADRLVRLERAVRAARLALPFARLGCEAFVNLSHMECVATVDTLADLADAGAEILKTARACREGGDGMCLEHVAQQADALLPKLERLLERAELLAHAPQGAPPATAAAATLAQAVTSASGSAPTTGGGRGGGAGGHGGGPR